jgi:hypothetical protein
MNSVLSCCEDKLYSRVRWPTGLKGTHARQLKPLRTNVKRLYSFFKTVGLPQLILTI